MPRGGILTHMPDNASTERILEVNATRGVSARALAHRAHELGLSRPWSRRRSLGNLKQTAEDTQDDPASESSRLLPSVFRALHRQGITPLDVAEELHLPIRELNHYAIGLDLLPAED
jgi:hypothetical protein